MKKEVTINIHKNLLKKAEAYAEAQEQSLSDIATQYLKTLLDSENVALMVMGGEIDETKSYKELRDEAMEERMREKYLRDIKVEATLNIDKDILDEIEQYLNEEITFSLLIVRHFVDICQWRISLRDWDPDLKMLIETQRERVADIKEQLKNAEAELKALETEISAEEILV